MKVNPKITFDRYGQVVTGHIEDVEMYEDVKSGKKRWKEHMYNRITHIRIPKEVFERLLELDSKAAGISQEPEYGDVMSFPETFKEFAERYKIVDKEEVYTNGTELIPIFRVKQWLDHVDVVPRAGVAREIFAEIKRLADVYLDGELQFIGALEDLEKKYTEGK